MSDASDLDSQVAAQAVARHHANELNAQLGTLRHFTKHPGENGRLHEYYLREVLRRFLPGRFRLGTGFVATSTWTSRQCDLLIYDTEWPPIFQAGELVVCSLQMAEGVIESKTDLGSTAALHEALSAQAEIEDARQKVHVDDFRPTETFRGIYAFEGLTLAALSDAIFDWVKTRKAAGMWKNPEYGSRRAAPHAIFVRNRYLLLRFDPDSIKGGAEREAMKDVAYQAVHLNEANEGEALLAFVGKFWETVSLDGFDRARPPWLRLRSMPSLREAELIHWPSGV